MGRLMPCRGLAGAIICAGGEENRPEENTDPQGRSAPQDFFQLVRCLLGFLGSVLEVAPGFLPIRVSWYWPGPVGGVATPASERYFLS